MFLLYCCRFRQQAPAVPVHYEWASIGGADLAGDILTFVQQHVDSMGFNEEECRAILSAVGSAELAAASFAHSPPLALVERALAAMFRQLPASVTRLHFHSLGLHVIGVRQGSRWRAENAAVLTGSVATSLRVCNATELDEKSDMFQVLAEESFDTSDGRRLTFSPHANWTHDGIAFSACPVLVCRQPVQTVGAGDSISSSALIRSLRNLAPRE